MILEIQKVKKPTKKRPLNSGYFFKNYENRPCLTFWVDSKKLFWNFKKPKNLPQKLKKDPPKLPKT